MVVPTTPGPLVDPRPAPDELDELFGPAPEASVGWLDGALLVVGLVLFGSGADFTKGRPKDVLLPAELVERYRKPDQVDRERLAVAFAPHWERVKAAIEPVKRGAREKLR